MSENFGMAGKRVIITGASGGIGGATTRLLAQRQAKLVLVDRDTCMDGPKAKRWFAQAGIEQNVVWLKPPRSSGFSRAELVNNIGCFHIFDHSEFHQRDVGIFGDHLVEEPCACAGIESLAADPSGAVGSHAFAGRLDGFVFQAIKKIKIICGVIFFRLCAHKRCAGIVPSVVNGGNALRRCLTSLPIGRFDKENPAIGIGSRGGERCGWGAK